MSIMKLMTSIKRYILLQNKKNDRRDLLRIYTDKDILNLAENLKVKKEQQSQLIDTRNYFIYKFFLEYNCSNFCFCYYYSFNKYLFKII